MGPECRQLQNFIQLFFKLSVGNVVDMSGSNAVRCCPFNHHRIRGWTLSSDQDGGWELKTQQDLNWNATVSETTYSNEINFILREVLFLNLTGWSVEIKLLTKDRNMKCFGTEHAPHTNARPIVTQFTDTLDPFLYPFQLAKLSESNAFPYQYFENLLK